MANPLPNEAEVFAQIKERGTEVPEKIWEKLHGRISDCMTAIGLISAKHLKENKAMAVSNANFILNHAKEIDGIMRECVYPKKTESGEMIYPDIDEKIAFCFQHYISNDLNRIVMICYSYTDPKYPEDIPIEDVKKIMDAVSCMDEFLENIRSITPYQLER